MAATQGSPEGSAIALEAHDVWKVYGAGAGDQVAAVAGVSLQVKRGEFVALMGPSGSGKTTLLHLMGALDVPTRGDILYGGQGVHGLSEKELARLRGRSVGFVFQSFHLVPRLTALENVMLPMRFVESDRTTRRSRAMDLLKRVGLGDRSHHAPSELSGGQKQRVAIARALVNNPQIVLADEPTGNLDSKTGVEILALFDELNREGRTIMIVTHDASVAARSNRIFRMLDGKLVNGSDDVGARAPAPPGAGTAAPAAASGGSPPGPPNARKGAA
ncbi:MAG: ABC transporter ATP-binding protein [Thermoplasmatota archaeon]